MSHERFAKLNKLLKSKGIVKIDKWLITADGIKRQYTDSDGKRHWQRLPIDLYRDLDEVGRKDLLNRLNAEDWRMKKALDNYEIQSSFIPPKILAEFERKLAQDSLPETAKSRMQQLKRYCLEYFLPKSPNPIEWQRDLQEEWLNYLVALDLSTSTYKQIRTSVNKFMRFLAKKNRDLPILLFDGLTPFQIAEIRYKREVRGLGLRRFIPESEFTIIYNAADTKLQPYIAIAYAYGLRRNELRALTPIKIKTKHLLVDSQKKDNGTYTLPKYRKIRKVPHWMMTPKDLHTHITNLKPYATGPDLSDAFSFLTDTLCKAGEITNRYVLHDCRHSFVSNAVKTRTNTEVMMAAGHSDLRTTSGYIQDTRELDDETFDPTGS